MKKEIKQMKIKSIKTLFGERSFKQIQNVFSSLPYEKDIANAIHGDMEEFLQYVENSKKERNSPESNGSFYYYDYSEVQQYRTSVNEDGKEFLSEVTFITPTSDRVITIKEIGVVRKNAFYSEPCNDYEINIDFGEDGSSYAANEVICGLKTKSFNDEYTEIQWMDGRITSALDYKMATLDKLSLRRSSYTAINQYDKVINRNRSFVIFSAMPQVDLLSYPCELLVDQMNEYEGDLVVFIENQYYEKYYREIFVDRDIFDLIVDKVEEQIKNVLTIVPRELEDGDSVLVYIKEESRMMGITYIKD